MSNLSEQSKEASYPSRAKHAGEAIARQPEPFRDELLASLKTPNTGTPYLTHALQKYLPSLLLSDGVAVPDDPEEMRWRLFFAHSQDMLGFRADIFTGGPNEENNPYFPNYRGLRDRWANGRTMLEGLASLWLNSDTRKTLTDISHPFRSKESKSLGIQPAMELLRGPQGNEATRVFADAFDELKGHKIAHKTNAIIRAYCQNSALLAPHDYCFRNYLLSIVPDWDLPAVDVTAAEAKWRERIMRDFYHVGPALAPYLIADWLFWLWRNGQIEWFDSYKADSVWLKALANGAQNGEAILPPEAAVSSEAFVAYCRTLILPPEWIPAPLWHIAFYHIPPRLINEVLWLEEAATGEQLKASQGVPKPHLAEKLPLQKIVADISHDLPIISQAEDNSAAETMEEDPDDPYTFVPLLEPAYKHSEDMMHLPIRLLSHQGILYLVAFTSLREGEQFLEEEDFPRIKQPLSTTIDMFVTTMKADVRIRGFVLDPGGAEPHVKMREELPETLIQTEVRKAEDMLYAAPLSEAASPVIMAALGRVLQSAGVSEARGVYVTYIDMKQTWLIAVPTSDAKTIAEIWDSIMHELRLLMGGEANVLDVALCDLRGDQLAARFGESLI